MKLSILIAACSLGLVLTSPVMAQQFGITNNYENTTRVTTPEQAPGFAVGAAVRNECGDSFSIGGSAPGTGMGISIPLPGKARGLCNDRLALANSGSVAELFGTAAAQRYALQSPRIRAAVFPEQTRVRSSRSVESGVAPARSSGGNPFAFLARGSRVTYPSEPVADKIVSVSSRSGFPLGNTEWAQFCASGEFRHFERGNRTLTPNAIYYSDGNLTDICSGKSRRAQAAVAERSAPARTGERQIQVGKVTCVVDQRGVLINIGRPSSVTLAAAEQTCGTLRRS